MGRIYTAPRLVLVWLGSQPHWHEGIPGLEKMALHVPDSQLPPFLGYMYDEKRSISSMQLAQSLDLVRDGCKPLEYEGNLALELTQRLWFKRTWVLQEFLLAEQVVFIYGDQQISKEAVRKAFIWAYASNSGGYMSGKDIVAIPRFVTELWSSHVVSFPRLLDARNFLLQGERLTLEQWIRLSSGRRASDPRDLVFVGLNLVKEDCVCIDRDALQLKSVGASNELRPTLPPRPTKNALSIPNPGLQPTMKSTTLLPRGLWSKLETDYKASGADVSVNLAACLLSQGLEGISQLLSLAARPISDDYEGEIWQLPEPEPSYSVLSNTPSWAPHLGSWNVCTSHRRSLRQTGPRNDDM
jgi:hypothetical protein